MMKQHKIDKCIANNNTTNYNNESDYSSIDNNSIKGEVIINKRKLTDQSKRRSYYKEKKLFQRDFHEQPLEAIENRIAVNGSAECKEKII